MMVPDRKSTRLNSSHLVSSYAVFCLKKKKLENRPGRRREWRRPDQPSDLGLRQVYDETIEFRCRQQLAAKTAVGLAFFFYGYGDRRDLHSFPTRRSSDLIRDRYRESHARPRSCGLCHGPADRW